MQKINADAFLEPTGLKCCRLLSNIIVNEPKIWKNLDRIINPVWYLNIFFIERMFPSIRSQINLHIEFNILYLDTSYEIKIKYFFIGKHAESYLNISENNNYPAI